MRVINTGMVGWGQMEVPKKCQTRGGDKAGWRGDENVGGPEGRFSCCHLQTLILATCLKHCEPWFPHPYGGVIMWDITGASLRLSDNAVNTFYTVPGTR